MGYTTDLIGHFDICPPLNVAEQHYLAAFSATRHCVRPGGVYDVPGNPFADPVDVTADMSNTVAADVPSFWCQWSVSWDGEALSHDGLEKFYGATEWLRYLIDHFLAPGAYARTNRTPYFEQFTFNHQVNGIVAANRRDIGRLYLIQADNNHVAETTLVPGRSEYPEDLLPYEFVRDEAEGPHARRRRAN